MCKVQAVAARCNKNAHNPQVSCEGMHCCGFSSLVGSLVSFCKVCAQPGETLPPVWESLIERSKPRGYSLCTI